MSDVIGVGSGDAATRWNAVVEVDPATGEPVPGATAANQATANAIITAPGDVIDLTPTLDTNAFTAGDLLFDATEVANFVRAVGGQAIIQSITVVDKDDQGAAFDLYVSRTTVDFGTVNSAPAISDADALAVQRVGRVEATDYYDLGGVRVATITNLGLVVEAAADSRSLFFAAVTQGTPTYTASGLQLRFGLIWL